MRTSPYDAADAAECFASWHLADLNSFYDMQRIQIQTV